MQDNLQSPGHNAANPGSQDPQDTMRHDETQTPTTPTTPDADEPAANPDAANPGSDDPRDTMRHDETQNPTTPDPEPAANPDAANPGSDDPQDTMRHSETQNPTTPDAADPEPVANPDAANPGSEDPQDTLRHFETQNPTTSLTPRQLIALPIVAAAPNLRRAARDAGVARATLYRWLDEVDFREELETLSAEAASLARAHFKVATLRAFHVLDDLMDHPNPWIRHSASRTMSQTALRITDTDDLRRDLQDLRAALDNNPGNHPR